MTPAYSSDEEVEEYEEEEEEKVHAHRPEPPHSPARNASPGSIRRAVESRTNAAAQQPAQNPKGPDPAVVQAKKDFFKHMDDQLLDYKHNHPIHVSNCSSTLLRIFTNVLDNPQEQKYRQLKAGGTAFKNNVSSIKGGEKLMTLAGWHTQVKDLEKYFVFEGAPGSRKMDILREAANTLQKAIATVNEKAERKRQEMQDAGAKDKERKEQVLRALEDDKERRKMRTGFAAASSSAAPVQRPQ